jgi:hypothetical protein
MHEESKMSKRASAPEEEYISCCERSVLRLSQRSLSALPLSLRPLPRPTAFLEAAGTSEAGTLAAGATAVSGSVTGTATDAAGATGIPIAAVTKGERCPTIEPQSAVVLGLVSFAGATPHILVGERT